MARVASRWVLWVLAGAADVAATSPHWGITRWILSTAMERAVKRGARHVERAPFLDDPERIRAGAVEYDEMCVSCHGAPGVEPSEVAEGLNPPPPKLAEAGEDEAGAFGPEEQFWVVKHGVRMTGMPAFGPTHSDEEIWEVVALVVRLPDLSPGEYRELTRTEPRHEDGAHHRHEHHELGRERGEARP